jgi:peptidoglycan/xylan/chitin deacetylase (PgdA/CDA1 family)
MYHLVSEDAAASYARYTVTPGAFAAQMRVLASLRLQPVSLDTIAASLSAGTPLPRRAVAITFDDGFAETVRHAAPVLARHGFTATFFIVAGLIGRTSEWTRRRRGIELPLADASTVREIAAAGLTVGSHTMTHRTLPDLGARECRLELLESKRRLEDAIGREVPHLSYPYGAAHEGVGEAAAEIGYRTACSTRDALVRRADDPLMLPRVPVMGGESLARFVRRLRPVGPIEKLVQRLRETMKVSALAR